MSAMPSTCRFNQPEIICACFIRLRNLCRYIDRLHLISASTKSHCTTHSNALRDNSTGSAHSTVSFDNIPPRSPTWHKLTTQNTTTSCVASFVSVPGTEQLQRLLSVGPQGYMFSNKCSKSNGNPQGETLRKNLRRLFSPGVRAICWV